jgi:hypothetical protein
MEHNPFFFETRSLPPYRSMRMDGRLLSFNLEDSDGFPLYQAYLENYYVHHKNPADVSIADAAFKVTTQVPYYLAPPFMWDCVFRKLAAKGTASSMLRFVQYKLVRDFVEKIVKFYSDQCRILN